jgi:UPF0716 family protein affecting phage T7 exclusion
MALTESETFGTVVAGFVTDQDGNLAVTSATTGATREVVPGFVTDADGRLIVSVDPETTSWQEGFLRTAEGYLGVTTEAEPEYGPVPGFATDSSGLLSVEAPDSPTWVTGFLRNSNQNLSAIGLTE